MEAQTSPAVTANALTEPAPIERKNLVQLVRDWPLSRKIATVAVLLISIALFGVLIFQMRTADQQLLYANLSLTDGAAVSGWLKNQKINYTIRNGGKDIWVSADQLYQTRLDLAANGLPSGGGIGFEVFDKQSFALTDYVQKVNYVRALQGELARTITSLEPVESTRVHLALPEKRLFKDQQQSGTASVIVSLVPGRSLDPTQVQGIIHLVAGSVTDLEPENVKVIDANGVVLESERKKDPDNLLSADMLAFQREVEHRLEMRAQDLLEKSMGKDNAMVRVSATLDFAKVEKTQELFDADDPVIRSEQINQESGAAQGVAGGIPGVQSNLQGNQFTADSATTAPASKNSRITNYEISKTVSRTVNPVGTVTKLSVSVLVADKTEVDADGKVTGTTPRTQEELSSIESMVASAIGIVADRGDVISVLSMPFVDTSTDNLAGDTGDNSFIYQYLPLIKYGLIAFGALLLYFLLVRPVVKTMRGEVKEHYKTVEQLEMEQKQKQIAAKEEEEKEPLLPVDDAITALRRDVMQNQVPTAFIVKNWIQEG